MTNSEIDDDEIIIRNYKTSDYEATLEILKQLHDKFDIGFKENQWRQSSGLRQFKPNLKRITLIAEIRSTGKVVAMGVLEALRNTLGQYIGYLDNWATSKDYIGKHVGRILADKAILMLKSWGCESVRINLSYKLPEKLINVFGKAGFEPKLIVLEKRFEEGE